MNYVKKIIAASSLLQQLKEEMDGLPLEIRKEFYESIREFPRTKRYTAATTAREKERLTKREREVIDTLKKMPSTTPEQMGRLIGASAHSVSGTLGGLYRLGLLDRKLKGRKFVYWIKGQEPIHRTTELVECDAILRPTRTPLITPDKDGST